MAINFFIKKENGCILFIQQIDKKFKPETLFYLKESEGIDSEFPLFLKNEHNSINNNKIDNSSLFSKSKLSQVEVGVPERGFSLNNKSSDSVNDKTKELTYCLSTLLILKQSFYLKGSATNCSVRQLSPSTTQLNNKDFYIDQITCKNWSKGFSCLTWSNQADYSQITWIQSNHLLMN